MKRMRVKEFFVIDWNKVKKVFKEHPFKSILGVMLLLVHNTLCCMLYYLTWIFAWINEKIRNEYGYWQKGEPMDSVMMYLIACGLTLIGSGALVYLVNK